MERTPVSSTNVASVGYDEGAAVLEVEFSSGSVYQYFDVPSSVFVELMGSGSIGQYLNAYVKPNYRYSQV